MNANNQNAILLREQANGIVTLTLNRPGARNALSTEMMHALQAELDSLREDKSARVVVLAANGPAFCAGHDLKEIRANPTRVLYERLIADCERLMLSITRLPQPVIAAVHGIATAAGCQLVATCDLAIAADTAKFATPGVHIGLFCSTPAVPLSRTVGKKHAMEMLLTGDMADAETAFRFGLVNEVVPAAELDAAVARMAGKIASKSPLTLAIGKESFYRQIDLPLAEAYRHAGAAMIRNLMARDAEEGIDAFIQKREPVWSGE